MEVPEFGVKLLGDPMSAVALQLAFELDAVSLHRFTYHEEGKLIGLAGFSSLNAPETT